MGLGSRNARAHSTQRTAVVSEDFADYSVGERVLTREGFIGRVQAVYDGPYPGTESYQISLEGGMGDGEYSTRDIVGTAATTQASVERTARDDYPELEDILDRRPDIAKGS